MNNYNRFINENIENLIKNLSDKEKEFLKGFETPVLRKFMTSDEIKFANLLYKKGVLDKGISDEKFGCVQYYVDSSIYRRL